jgi:hypothetical protein
MRVHRKVVISWLFGVDMITQTLLIRAFIAIVTASRDSHVSIPNSLQSYSSKSNNNQMNIGFTLRGKEPTTLSNSGEITHAKLILGDDSEWEDTLGKRSMGNGVYIEYN